MMVLRENRAICAGRAQNILLVSMCREMFGVIVYHAGVRFVLWTRQTLLCPCGTGVGTLLVGTDPVVVFTITTVEYGSGLSIRNLHLSVLIRHFPGRFPWSQANLPEKVPLK